ncbi:Na+/H+ antiporter subunit A [Shouchella clausii]|uniref:Na+/H+ antiporter subunit A n=1 Tax=Shouchella clausii TaxID=79880 RepID=A0A268S514_SHOCL|nr:Na+/H+ antiporter subunit A [Shouchella clausii]PAD43644.1 Na+/H+ antiporter subunit A [Bacillus sp. 7520-S]AST98135.1 Na+/H+ antiporter subunit A [Shouchella clausii]MBU8595318.1 Na+/H+ antiporter subunit A [Shouchella clausii]MCR1286931.1 Na+/H+ antiporter subunit A [Shouchella clausii]MCY1103376.1 Na+/H+ antiporter subunit A [Shouchella clausii]
MSSLHIAILIPFMMAILIPIIYPYTKKIHTGWFVLLVPTALFLYFLTFLPTTTEGGYEYVSLSWVPSLGINVDLYVDGLSLLFALLITGIGALVVLYSIYYLDKASERLHHFYVYLLMFMGAMVGVVLSDNLIVLYIFWELTSLASALLISYWFHRKASVYGAQKSMLITVFGGFAMLAGFCILYGMTGTFSVRDIIAQTEGMAGSTLFLAAMILVLLGAFTKSAQFPFHIWLPDAMEAPTPVSAYLHSATMVKAGIYLVARLTPVFGGDAVWFWTLVIAGLVTLTYGSITAVRQKDLKGILAYSTISQLGLIMSLLGVGSAAIYMESGEGALFYSLAITTAVFHLLNHATFKGSLFMAVGIIDHETGTRDIRKLGGLMTIMPITFAISAIGLASMAGLPPFNGFLSKEMFFTSLLRATEGDFFSLETIGFLLPVIAWVASVFTFLYCAVTFFKTFFGKFEQSHYEKPVHEAPFGMLISPVILVALVVTLGIFPNIVAQSLVAPAVTSILPRFSVDELDIKFSLWHGINTELLMTLAIILCGSVLLITMKKWSQFNIYKRERDPLHWFYDQGLDGLIHFSQTVTRVQMTGLLRDYFVYMCAFILLLLGWTFWYADAWSFNISSVATTPFFVYIVTAVFIVTALCLPFIQKRMTLIIFAGIIGYIMALYFAMFRAPDLALTQLLIETVTVVLLMLAFRHLPEMAPEKAAPTKKLGNIVISAAVGVTITVVGISAYSLGTDANFSSISDYYIENVYKLGGGTNMVNVILVDFRGLDTMLEVLVLGIVSLAVIMLIKHRFKGGEDV